MRGRRTTTTWTTTIVLSTLCALALCARARAMDDDDSARDMLDDFLETEGAATLYDENTGQAIEGSMAIVSASWDRRKSHVGVFLPSSAVKAGMTTTTVTLCEFSNPDACRKETPYPGAPSEYACGEDDEAREDTGFDCDSAEVPIEPDGDLSVDIELVDPESEVDYDEDDEDDDDEDAAPPSPARRKLLVGPRLGRANPRRSRTLRTTGARGAIRG